MLNEKSEAEGVGGTIAARDRVPRRLDNADTDRLAIRRGLVAVLAFAVPLVLAFNGGAYDVVTRQQMALPWLWAAALAVAFGLLPLARRSPQAQRALAAMAAFVLWTALSSLWSDSAERTSIEIARTVAYAGVLSTVLLSLSASTWRAAAHGLCAALLVLPIASLASRLAPGFFPSAVDASTLAGDRLLYPLEYWNAVACWAAMAIAAGLALSAHSRDWVRTVSLALVPVAIVTLYLTYSRGGIAAAAVGCVVVLAASRNRVTAAAHLVSAILLSGVAIAVIQTQPAIAEGTAGDGGVVVGLAVLAACGGCVQIARLTRRRGFDVRRVSLPSGGRIAVLVAALAAAAIVIAGPNLAARESRQFTDQSYVSNSPSPARLGSLDGPRAEIWSSAFRAFESAPLTGIGPGTFVYWWTGDVTNGDQLQDAHSLYIETLAELGLPGLLALLAFLGLLVAAALRALRSLVRGRDLGAAAAMIGIGAVFLTQAGVDWMWEIPAIALPGLGALTIAAASASKSLRRRGAITPARVALTLLCIVAGAAQIPALVSTQSLRTSAGLLPGGFDARARKLAEDASAASPWAASPHSQLALIDLARGQTSAARSEIKLAIEREPTNWVLPFIELRAALAQGDSAGALGALDRAAQLNPSIGDDAARIRRQIAAGNLAEPQLPRSGGAP